MTIELTFRELDRYAPDDWSRVGAIITEVSRLDLVRNALAKFRILAVKHWHYRGSRAPDHVGAD